MNKTKFWFGFLILFFISLFLITPFWFERINLFSVTPIIYNSTEHHSCHITITEPTIILRMDDVKAHSELTKQLVDETLSRNISITLGVIPRDLEKDNVIIEYLRQIKTNPYVEIAQHGTYHNETDKNVTEENLLKGNIKIQKILGIQPVTYIPPFNEISPNSKDIISSHFKIISKGDGILKEGEKIAEIGQTISTYDYSKNETISTETIVNKCKESLEKTNLCVITTHPQEYFTKIEDPKTFDDFKKLLDELQKLNTNFSNFKNLVYCSDSEAGIK